MGVIQYENNISLYIITSDKTSLPEETSWQGLLVVALDPFERFEDIDRSDNIFVQYVTVMDNGDLENPPFCSVKELGKYGDGVKNILRAHFFLGGNAFMMYNNYYEDPKRIVFNAKKNGIKAVEGKESKKANNAQVLAQVSTLRVNRKMSESCQILKKINKRKSDSQNLLLNKIVDITKLIVKNFDDMNHEAKLEGEQISLILKISSELVETVVSDKQMMKMLLRLIRKNGPPGNPGNGFGNNGGSGFNPGLMPPEQPPTPSWSTVPPPFWNSTFDWTSVPWLASSTPPPFWNSTYDWTASTLFNTTFDWTSVPWWASSTPPPFWNSTYDWTSSTLWNSTFNWTSSTPPPFWNSTYDWTSSTLFNSTFDWTSVPWWASSTPPPFWNSTYDWTSEPWWNSSSVPPFWNSTDFPFLNTTLDLNKTLTQLEEELSQLDEGSLNTLLSTLDENTLFDLYEKMNGSYIANDIEEVIFDTGHDEEASSWENIFGDSGDFFRRRKRQTRGKEKNRPKDFEENIAPMMAMGLQGFLMMDAKDLGFKLPKLLSKAPDCLKEILWESEGERNSRLCAKIPDSLKSKLKELMMMVLKKEISPKFVRIDWPGLLESVSGSGFAEELVKIVMSKIMLPLEEKDLSEVLSLVKGEWKEIVEKEKDAENRAILNLVTDLLGSLEKPDVISLMTEILQEIQGKS